MAKVLRRQDVFNCQLDTAGGKTSDPEGGSVEDIQIEAWRRKRIENTGIRIRDKQAVEKEIPYL